MARKTTRRGFLKGMAALGAAAGLGPIELLAGEPAKSPAPQAFRFVHLTDIHVKRERAADQGFALALKAVEALKPRPDFILTGGDLVFDALEVGPERARELFKLYRKVLADHTSLPVYNTLGNHDVFGWSTKSGVSPATAGYGKAMALDLLAMPSSWHRFDHKGWRFFCLDNIQPANRSERYPYRGYLDEPQREWFTEQLKQTGEKTPIVVCEHIPLITVTAFGHEEMSKSGDWQISGAFVCRDAAQRLALLRTRNTRLCLSGHIHERDRVEMGGITFINDGAVCGNWWKGAYRGVKEGFGVIDVRADGSFDHHYLEYGWQARAE